MGDLSAHFDSSESACRCGLCDKKEWSKEHVKNLEALRELVCKELKKKDWPVICTTTYGKNGGNRCVDQNTKADGAPSSRHMACDASDIFVPGMTPKELAKLAEQVGPITSKPGKVDGFGGIGVGKNIIHVDSRPRKPEHHPRKGKRYQWCYEGVTFAWAPCPIDIENARKEAEKKKKAKKK